MSRAILAILLAAFLPSGVVAKPLAVPEDATGWYAWRVAAAADAPAWCCYSRRNKSATLTCNLEKGGAWVTCGDAVLPGGEAQVYVQLRAGRAEKIRVLSPGCEVEQPERLTDLGRVEADLSFEWLVRQVERDAPASEEALAAIAVHDGERPLRWLVDAANGAVDGDLREGAIFWLGQGRIAETADALERLMFEDDDAEIRQQAAFALSQSRAPNRIDALIRQGREDEDGETRAQAWFWLAQTGAAESEKAILDAIASDPDRDVQEEAVFALSQLPDDRAVDALIGVLRDRTLRREMREQALFWLAQSDSERALAVVENLLTRDDGASY
jgi:hypothetical protein